MPCDIYVAQNPGRGGFAGLPSADLCGKGVCAFLRAFCKELRCGETDPYQKGEV